MHVPRPRLAFTLSFEGKDEWWHEDIAILEYAMHRERMNLASSRNVDRQAINILVRHYDDISETQYAGDAIEPIITQHLLCRILNGQNIRIFTDGSSE